MLHASGTSATPIGNQGAANVAHPQNQAPVPAGLPAQQAVPAPPNGQSLFGQSQRWLQDTYNALPSSTDVLNAVHSGYEALPSSAEVMEAGSNLVVQTGRYLGLVPQPAPPPLSTRQRLLAKFLNNIDWAKDKAWNGAPNARRIAYNELKNLRHEAGVLKPVHNWVHTKLKNDPAAARHLESMGSPLMNNGVRSLMGKTARIGEQKQAHRGHLYDTRLSLNEIGSLWALHKTLHDKIIPNATLFKVAKTGDNALAYLNPVQDAVYRLAQFIWADVGEAQGVNYLTPELKDRLSNTVDRIIEINERTQELRNERRAQRDALNERMAARLRPRG